MYIEGRESFNLKGGNLSSWFQLLCACFLILLGCGLIFVVLYTPGILCFCCLGLCVMVLVGTLCYGADWVYQLVRDHVPTMGLVCVPVCERTSLLFGALGLLDLAKVVWIQVGMLFGVNKDFKAPPYPPTAPF